MHLLFIYTSVHVIRDDNDGDGTATTRLCQQWQKRHRCSRCWLIFPFVGAGRQFNYAMHTRTMTSSSSSHTMRRQNTLFRFSFICSLSSLYSLAHLRLFFRLPHIFHAIQNWFTRAPRTPNTSSRQSYKYRFSYSFSATAASKRCAQ